MWVIAKPMLVLLSVALNSAFVAAWLPGTEGLGLADMLLAGTNGRASYDFTGRLSFDWPAGDCLPKSGGMQFRRGFGLRLASPSTLGRLPEPPPVVACPAESK